MSSARPRILAILSSPFKSDASISTGMFSCLEALSKRASSSWGGSRDSCSSTFIKITTIDYKARSASNPCHHGGVYDRYIKPRIA